MTRKEFENKTEKEKKQWIDQNFGNQLEPTEKNNPFYFLNTDDEHFWISWEVDVDYSIYNVKSMDVNTADLKRQDDALNRVICQFNEMPLHEKQQFLFQELVRVKEPVRPEGVKSIDNAPAFLLFSDNLIPRSNGEPDGWGIKYLKVNDVVINAEAARMEVIEQQVLQFGIALTITDTGIAN